MSITAQTLANLKSPYLKHLSGPLTAPAEWVYPPEHCQSTGLTVVSKPEQLSLALQKKASIIVAIEGLQNDPQLKNASAAVFWAPGTSVAFAVILPLFSQKQERFPVGIHATAIIATSAKLGQNVKIGPYVVIGEDAQVAANSVVGSHSVIEASAKVGQNCILHAHVFIGAQCEVGNNCEIHPFSCIGSDGFGYVQAPDKTRHKIPQIGKVVLEDNVEIGSLCAIDRATIFETRIRKGAKLDNHVHIAHNCTVGENSALTAGFMTAGSTVMGANFTTAGMVGVADHLTIADDVTIGAKSGVTKDITQPGTYVGYPVVPFKEGLRNMSASAKLYQIKRDLQMVLEHLKLKSKD